ncbi:MAG: hypothetical protein JWN99_247 [Ilumatobacteraceae bacterium]|nr:hypothetical protein [Ilumatobacteraceae bacterium]
MHTDSPETSVAAVADAQPSSGLRRRLVGAGLIGLAGSLLPRFASSAGASTDTTDTSTGDTTPAATTTTAPPKRPTTDDVDLLAFAHSLELSIVQLYDIALASGSLTDPALAIVTNVHQSHVSYAQSLNGFLGRIAPGVALPDVVQSNSDDFGGDQDAILAAAYQLEDTAVATHTEIIGQIEGTDGSALIASILIIEAQHALVFADLAGETDLDALILTNAKALEPGEG